MHSSVSEVDVHFGVVLDVDAAEESTVKGVCSAGEIGVGVSETAEDAVDD